MRLRSLHILSMGYTVKDVSRLSPFDGETIYRWAEDWEYEGSVPEPERLGMSPFFGEKEK